MKTFLTTLGIIGTVLSAPLVSRACPLVAGLPDSNCDGLLVIAVLGDSLVAGIGDSLHGGKGGYVLRAAEQLPDVRLHNFGEGGATATNIIFDVERAFAGRGHTRLRAGLTEADLVVLDVGRNDQWTDKTPLATRRNLKRIQTSIQHNVKSITGHTPLVVTAVLMIPKRLRQVPWIGELNGILRSSNTIYAPTDLRFDTIPKKYLSPDRIHPTSKGYDKLAKVFISYIASNYPLHVRDLRRDRDHDGLYDEFERERFGTDPTLSDTDGDGIRDGDDPSPLG
ncbi:MAG: Spore germination lipase LipC [Pseudomonadota bacterium]